MIDLSLEENEAKTSINLAGPSISDAAGASDKTWRNDVEADNLQDKLESHARAMQETHKKLVLTKSTSIALKNLVKKVKNTKKKLIIQFFTLAFNLT